MDLNEKQLLLRILAAQAVIIKKLDDARLLEKGTHRSSRCEDSHLESAMNEITDVLPHVVSLLSSP
jgi:hypothetical protein